MAKYNQLLRIEEELGDTAYFPGKKSVQDKIIVIILFI
jgi:enolase